jgi:hypothetical protein
MRDSVEQILIGQSVKTQILIGWRARRKKLKTGKRKQESSLCMAKLAAFQKNMNL